MHLHELFPFCMDFAGFLAIWTPSGALYDFAIIIFLRPSLGQKPRPQKFQECFHDRQLDCIGRRESISEHPLFVFMLIADFM